MSAEFSRVLPAKADALPELWDAIEAWLGGAGVPGHDIPRLMIALDELVSNIAHHGGKGASIAIRIAVVDKAVVITLSDNGPPFDPLARPAPDTGLDIDARAIGGLGIHLVRELMDELSYVRENGWNRLTLRKTF